LAQQYFTAPQLKELVDKGLVNMWAEVDSRREKIESEDTLERIVAEYKANGNGNGNANANAKGNGRKLIKFIFSNPDEEKVEEWDFVDEKDDAPPEVVVDEATSSSSNAEAEVIVKAEQSINATHPNWLMTSSVKEEEQKTNNNSNNSSNSTNGNSNNPTAANIDKIDEMIISRKDKLEEKKFETELPAHCVVCSQCGVSIRGTRWKCFFCELPYNLCSVCEPNTQHNPLHPFIRIIHPNQCPDTGLLSTNYAAFEVVTPLGTDANDSVEPGETFFAGWRFRNGSNKVWPNNLQIRRWGGRHLDCEAVNLMPLAPKSEVDVLVELKVPIKGKVKEGSNRTVFRIFDGEKIVGAPLVVEINVEKVKRPVEKNKDKAPFQDELAMLHSMGFKDRQVLLPLFQQGKSFAEVVEVMIIESSKPKARK